jgi:hypothetical protein
VSAEQRGPDRATLSGVQATTGESRLTAEAPAAVGCDWCGHTIGVFEPLVIFHAGIARESTRADEFRLPLFAHYYHRDCYRTL